MSPSEIREMVDYALEKGATYVKVGEFEMGLPAPTEPIVRGWNEGPYDKDEDHDPETQTRKEREAGYALLTHSG